MASKEEAEKVRYLLLWIGDKGLDIYNTAVWGNDGDELKLQPVYDKLEAYTKPCSNHILARFRLRSLKQGEKSLEEFVTAARGLIDEGGYAQAFVEETLRDTLVFGLNSDKVRNDAIGLGNGLRFQQIYDLAKTEECTKAQMKIITANENKDPDPELHSMKLQQYTRPNRMANVPRRKLEEVPTYVRGGQNFNSWRGSRPYGQHRWQGTPPERQGRCNSCGQLGHFWRACPRNSRRGARNVYTMETDVHGSRNPSNNQFTEPEHDGYGIGAITQRSKARTRQLNGISSRSNIFVTLTVNDGKTVRFKVDTGADICAITKDDFSQLKIRSKVDRSDCILHKYGGGIIETLGKVTLKITFGTVSMPIEFIIVEGNGCPSVIGCEKAQELGIVSVHLDSIAKFATKQNADKGTLQLGSVLKDYSDCFDKIGRFPGKKYHIELEKDAVPIVHPPRSVPVHHQPLFEAELKKMVKDGIIEHVTQPTAWVNSVVLNVTRTEDGRQKCRICLDPRDLNQNIKREHHYNRTIDEILPLLHGQKYFSVVDTKKGFWHVELDEVSSLLCTFNTPFGRFKFKRLPFGINVSGDIFQRKLDAVFQNIPNITGIADDIIIFGRTEQEHDQAFVNMLEACRKANIGLNSDKVQFKQHSVKFYGHILTSKGLKPAEDKLRAIRSIRAPKDTKELLSLLGMITYLNRFSARLASLTKPLRELTKKHAQFSWEKHHQEALDQIKHELCQARIISYYDPDPETITILQCDASQSNLGAWLYQINNVGEELIVAMGSRALTKTETRYSNIERECLAVAFGLEKFEYFLMGRHVLVETDHAPLEQIFKKNIADAPSRLQRLILKCLKYDITVKYKAGIKIPLADGLSRVIDNPKTHEIENATISFLSHSSVPISMEVLRSAVQNDIILNQLKDIIHRGWPQYRQQCPRAVWDYWNFRCDLTVEDGLVVKGDRIVIPPSLRRQILNTIHAGHLGETKCLLSARQSVFWPGMTKDIVEMVKCCETCNKYHSAQPKMPILQPELPVRPWEKIGTDIFEFEGKKYLMIVDYYSRFPIVRPLTNISADCICNVFTDVLTEYGLCSTILSDFGSQYISQIFRAKCKANAITLLFSSPYHHQVNSLAEKMIGVCRILWKKAREEGESLQTSLWTYRVTPFDYKTPSPYELLFGRKPVVLLPASNRSMLPKHPNRESHQESNIKQQDQQREFYNRRGTQDKSALSQGENVYIWNDISHIWEPGKVIDIPNPLREPRTYRVELNSKVFTRTRDHLKPRASTRMPQDERVDNPEPASDVNSTPQLQETENTSSPLEDLPTATQELPSTSNQSSGSCTSYQPKVYTTRSGRTTRIPPKFETE